MTTEKTESISTSSKRLKADFFAESRLLRALFNTKELLEDPRISEEVFSSSSTKNIYKALSNLAAKGVTATRDALYQEYSIIDLNASQDVVDVVADSSNIETDVTDMLDQLVDFKKRREVVSSLQKAISTIESTARVTPEQYEEIDEAVTEAALRLRPTQDGSGNDGNLEPKTMTELFSQYENEFTKRKDGKTYWFRNHLFDSIIPDGPQPGEIGIIASSSGSGKSTLCLNLVNSLIECRVPCAYYSLEMSNVTTLDRLLAKRLHIKYSTLKNPPEEEYEDIQSKIEEEKKRLLEECGNRFHICESGDTSIAKLERDIKRFQKESGSRYWVILVDLLSMMPDFTHFTGGTNFAQGIEVAINKLSAMVKRTGVHLIGVLQLNRQAEADTSVHSLDDLDKLKPNRAQIKNANAFLERARYVITAFRKIPYAKLYLQPEEWEGVLQDMIEVTVSKINNGEVGKESRGLFDGEYFDIIPMETEADVPDATDLQDAAFQ